MVPVLLQVKFQLHTAHWQKYTSLMNGEFLFHIFLKLKNLSLRFDNCRYLYV